MKLSDDDIKEFQGLYKRHIGRELSKSEAVAEATLLLDLVKLLSEPIDSDLDAAFIEEHFWSSESPRAKIRHKRSSNPAN